MSLSATDIETLLASDAFREALKSYLTDHLSLNVDLKEDTDYYGTSLKFTASVSLDGEQIASDSDYYSIPNYE
jgi:hypothetical protein